MTPSLLRQLLTDATANPWVKKQLLKMQKIFNGYERFGKQEDNSIQQTCESDPDVLLQWTPESDMSIPEKESDSSSTV